jgi:outer membrane protein assembly factor BamB
LAYAVGVTHSLHRCVLSLLLIAGATTMMSAWPPEPAPPASAAAPWPSFRGTRAEGVAVDQQLPTSWNATTGTNVQWKVRVPGLAHSSPIVWEDRVFVTSAVSSSPVEASFKPGLYGEGTASSDRSPHKWMVLAYDRKTGRLLWERVAFEGVPVDKRHIKSTYASSTPATNGAIVVAAFGSQGLYAYDVKGTLLWKRDLGRMDVGAYNMADYEWGPASSPYVWRDRVFVQVDTSREDFVAALELKTGKELWRTAREELPSWGTPTVIESSGHAELVTNGSNFIRGYDPLTGKELWRLGGSSQITAPTPILAGGLIIVASGRAPERPIFAIRPGARGDITLTAGQRSNYSVAWSWTQRGSYMPTPLAYDGLVYVLANQGLFDCYDLATGAEVYRQRLPHAGSGFSASPVAADGRIYLSSEDGDMFVVKAGRTFALETTNPIGEPLMATPAITHGTMIVRGERHLYAIGRADLKVGTTGAGRGR